MADFNQMNIDEFRANGGRTSNFGDRLVLVHHIGAKSGTERISPVAAIPDGGGWLIAASKAGAPENPAWYHNLLAHPDVEIEARVHGAVETVPVHVTELEGAERDEAWSRFTRMSEGFASYERKTTRTIPVLRLTPTAAG